MVDDPNRPDEDDMHSFMEEDDFLAAERDDHDGEFGNGLDEPAAKPNLKEIWEQNSSLKVFAVIAGIGVFLIAFMVFGGDDDNAVQEPSSVRQAGEVTQPPGTQELSPAYEEAVREESERRAEEAANSGGSSIPTPIARPSERIEAPVQVEEVDPLTEWRREAEVRRNEPEVPDQTGTAPPMPGTNNFQGNNTLGDGVNNAAQPPPLPTGPTPDQVNQMAQQLQQQMQTILETQVPKESVVVSLNIQPAYKLEKYFPPENQNVAGPNGTGAGATGAAGTTGSTYREPPKPLIAAGTIAYAQVITQANSDVPGPVLAEIASGPLQGARAIGQFQVAQRHLVLQFNRVVKDGKEYQTQAFALDPATTLPGVVTGIDRHYFSRVFLPAAASFIEGFAEAATQQDSTVVVTAGTAVTTNNNDLDTRQEILKGINEGAGELSQVLDQDFGNRPITIKVESGTRIGILFVTSVIDPAAQAQYSAATGQQQGANGQYGTGYGQQGGYAGYGQAMLNSTAAGQAYNAYNAYSGQQNGYGAGTAGGGYYAPQQQYTNQQQNYIPTPQTQSNIR